MAKKSYDFSGWATKNDIRCADGRIIRKNAFLENDGQVVPLVWQHDHSAPINVIGHALLENRPEGVYTYASFNDTEYGQHAKEMVRNGDVTSLSIYANRLKEDKGTGDVFHGSIREVSLVLAGANPGAFIDVPYVSHSEDGLFEATIYSGEEGLELFHEAGDAKDSEETGGKEVANTDDERTVQDVIDEMTDEQIKVVEYLIDQAVEGLDDEEDEDDEEEEEEMKHNVFDAETERNSEYLSHAEMSEILELAKQPGVTFQSALNIWADQHDVTLQHDAVSSGFVQDPTATGNVSWLFPEYKDVRPGAPELITNDQGWIGTVLSKVHKSPISRVRTQQVDIRNIDALRAKGYQKGKQKAQTGNFQLVRRTTDPQTIYVKSALHRDDIIDITDFDYVQYLYKIDRMNLNEELAMAIMLGDFRGDEAEDKIFPEHIRPIWTDDELYTKHVDLDVEAMKTSLQGDETGGYFGDNFVYAEALIEKLLYARETMKGTGTPDFFMTPHMLNVMLLARDRNGRRIFSSKSELASALNVGQIITAEQFANRIRTDDDSNKHKLLGICVNLADYTVGSTKGGEITHFTQFDIDFNQQKSLLETRCSGALTRVYSAVVIEEPYTE